MAKVTYFEISADDPKRVRAFFEKTFGWKFEKYGDQDYWLATTGKKEDMGINGAVMPRKEGSQPVVNTIGVENLDETIKLIEKNGGKVVVPKMEVPKVGWLAYFLDTEGNMHGVIEPMPGSMM